MTPKPKPAPNHPILETERLILRALSQEDEDAIFRLRSHPETFKYVDIKPYASVERARNFIKAVEKDIANGEAFFWGVALKDTDTVIGTVCLWNFQKFKSHAEMGFEILPSEHGKGYGTEAVSAVLHWMDKQEDFEIIDGITHEENLPSRKLLEKSGFQHLGIAVDIDPEIDEPRTMLLYRLVRRP
ncbi:MAG: GNAT family N-acetyltransferase [Firmicutes bacterium]|nr:GNAT family N-acetyltransferase [Bacillota bacterium]